CRDGLTALVPIARPPRKCVGSSANWSAKASSPSSRWMTATAIACGRSPMAERVQLSRRKGWRMPPNTVKVDRSTRWGNPYQAGQDGDGSRRYLVGLFRDYLARPEQSDLVAAIRDELRG